MRSRRAPAARRDRPSAQGAALGRSLICYRGRIFSNTFIVSSGFWRRTTRDEAANAVDENIAHFVAAGRPVIANHDLVTRWREGTD